MKKSMLIGIIGSALVVVGGGLGLGLGLGLKSSDTTLVKSAPLVHKLVEPSVNGDFWVKSPSITTSTTYDEEKMKLTTANKNSLKKELDRLDALTTLTTSGSGAYYTYYTELDAELGVGVMPSKEQYYAKIYNKLDTKLLAIVNKFLRDEDGTTNKSGAQLTKAANLLLNLPPFVNYFQEYEVTISNIDDVYNKFRDAFINYEIRNMIAAKASYLSNKSTLKLGETSLALTVGNINYMSSLTTEIKSFADTLVPNDITSKEDWVDFAKDILTYRNTRLSNWLQVSVAEQKQTVEEVKEYIYQAVMNLLEDQVKIKVNSSTSINLSQNSVYTEEDVRDMVNLDVVLDDYDKVNGSETRNIDWSKDKVLDTETTTGILTKLKKDYFRKHFKYAYETKDASPINEIYLKRLDAATGGMTSSEDFLLTTFGEEYVDKIVDSLSNEQLNKFKTINLFVGSSSSTFSSNAGGNLFVDGANEETKRTAIKDRLKMSDAIPSLLKAHYFHFSTTTNSDSSYIKEQNYRLDNNVIASYLSYKTPDVSMHQKYVGHLIKPLIFSNIIGLNLLQA